MRILFALLLLLSPPALAGDAARAQGIFHALRCPVCAGQSVAESESPVAASLRAAVRARIAAGDGDAQVYAYIRARYGDSAVSLPPVSGRTVPLWLLPAGIFLCAGFLAARRLRRGR